MLEKGLFVVFEGIDGSGTSTQVNHLQSNIANTFDHQDIITTHEPWRPSVIKTHLEKDEDAYSHGKDMTQYYILDREDHLNNSMIPNLKQGAIVLCARYRLSTSAFQGTQGVPHSLIDGLHKQINAPEPDLTFFLDVEYETARKRIEARAKPLEKFEKNPKFVKKLIESYENLVKKNEFGPNYTIDANHLEKNFVEQNGIGLISLINANQSEEKVAQDVFNSFMLFYDSKIKS